jgi:hypothetical protein
LFQVETEGKEIHEKGEMGYRHEKDKLKENE